MMTCSLSTFALDRRAAPVLVMTLSGLVTRAMLPRLRARLSGATPGRAALLDCRRAVWGLTDEQLAAALATFEPEHMLPISVAWVCAAPHLEAANAAALQVAQHGIARRVFSEYAPAAAWVQAQACLPQW